MVYFVNICEGTGIRKIVTNILKILLRWTGYVTDQISKCCPCKEKQCFCKNCSDRQVEVWQYQRNRTLAKLDVWPNVMLAGFIHHLVHHLGSATKTNKPALGRVGRIRVGKQWTKLKFSLNYLRMKVNVQNETPLVLFAFMKIFWKVFWSENKKSTHLKSLRHVAICNQFLHLKKNLKRLLKQSVYSHLPYYYVHKQRKLGLCQIMYMYRDKKYFQPFLKNFSRRANRKIRNSQRKQKHRTRPVSNYYWKRRKVILKMCGKVWDKIETIT